MSIAKMVQRAFEHAKTKHDSLGETNPPAVRLRGPLDGPQGFNLNEPVWVRLTDEGLAVHNDRYLKYGIEPTNPVRNGWAQYQLWTLMEIFGPVIRRQNARPYFVKNEVFFEDPR